MVELDSKSKSEAVFPVQAAIGGNLSFSGTHPLSQVKKPEELHALAVLCCSIGPMSRVDFFERYNSCLVFKPPWGRNRPDLESLAF